MKDLPTEELQWSVVSGQWPANPAGQLGLATTGTGRKPLVYAARS